MRGPTLSEQRAEQQRKELAAMAAAEDARKEKAAAQAAARAAANVAAARSADVVAPLCAGSVGQLRAGAAAAAGGGVRGRVRANAAELGATGHRGLAALVDREQSLMAKGEFRPTGTMVAIAPAGTGNMGAAPDRADYPRGAPGTEAYEADMKAFESGNLDDAGSENRTLDMYEREVGLFGYWAYGRGHEQAVEWVQEEKGWRLVPLKVRAGSVSCVHSPYERMETAHDAKARAHGAPDECAASASKHASVTSL